MAPTTVADRPTKERRERGVVVDRGEHTCTGCSGWLVSSIWGVIRFLITVLVSHRCLGTSVPTRYSGSMAFPTTEEIAQRLHPIVDPRRLDVEKVEIKKAGAKSSIIIRVDGDKRPDLNTIEEVSDAISRVFDAAEQAGELNFGAGYRLEVSTPGFDEPLVAARHFRRQRGHVATFVMSDDTVPSFVGRIGALDSSETELAVIIPGKTAPSVSIYPLREICEAKLEVEFSAPPEAEIVLTNTSFDQLS